MTKFNVVKVVVKFVNGKTVVYDTDKYSINVFDGVLHIIGFKNQQLGRFISLANIIEFTTVCESAESEESKK